MKTIAKKTLILMLFWRNAKTNLALTKSRIKV